jgi:hypothetical protein
MSWFDKKGTGRGDILRTRVRSKVGKGTTHPSEVHPKLKVFVKIGKLLVKVKCETKQVRPKLLRSRKLNNEEMSTSALHDDDVPSAFQIFRSSGVSLLFAAESDA